MAEESVIDAGRLKKMLDSFSGDREDLYRTVVLVDKDSNEFNWDDYDELCCRTMYLYHKMYGIESIYSQHFTIPFIAKRDISYIEFKKYLEELEQYEVEIDVLPHIKNHGQNIKRIGGSKLLNMADWDWTKVYSSKITGRNVETLGKIYLSVDNKDLYKFAYLLLEKCLEFGLDDYEYKVNNDDSKTRSDNVVVYFTEDNFWDYYVLISTILYENPNIQLNESNVLGVLVGDDGIVCGRDFKAENKSYSDKMCSAIVELRSQGMSNEQIVDVVDNLAARYVCPFLESCTYDENKKYI